MGCSKMENKSLTCHTTSEMQLIDVDAFREFWNKNYRHQYANDNFIFAIANFPTVDAVEVVHGRWVKNKPNPKAMRKFHKQGIGKAMSEDSIFWTCSCCEMWGTPIHNYCPNCGALMDGDGNG